MTTTTRLGLTKPATSDLVNIGTLNANSDLIDGAVGAKVVTSGTRPSTPFDGQVIYETDTQKTYVYVSSTTSWKLLSASVTLCTSSTRPSPAAEGQVIYETNTKISYVYSSGSWVAVVSREAVDAVLPIDTEGYSYKSTITYTSSGSFTKASYSWLRAVKVICVGGGGSGGGVNGAASGVGYAPGGGGGAYAEKFLLVAQLGATETVTVAGITAGVNGDSGIDGDSSSFGSLVAATGGAGGSVMNATTASNTLAGGDGGDSAFCTGDIKISGGAGTVGKVTSGVGVLAGAGGASARGYGMGARALTTTGDGNSGLSYGSGGSGAIGSSVDKAGGDGGPGIVIVELYG